MKENRFDSRELQIKSRESNDQLPLWEPPNEYE